MEENKRHILIVNLPYAGHTNPSLGLVRCLVAAGHEVDYVQAEGFRARVEASGALELTDAVGLDEAARLGADVARQLLAHGAAEVTDLGATKTPRRPS